MTKEQKERLDKAMSRWKYMGHCFDREEMGLAVTLIDEQAAENQRLREALKGLLDWTDSGYPFDMRDRVKQLICLLMRDKAEAALEGKDE